MLLFIGFLFGQAVHMALTQAGVTVRQPRYYIFGSSTFGGMIALYASLIRTGYTENLALLISGLTMLSMIAIAFTWHQRHRRAR